MKGKKTSSQNLKMSNQKDAASVAKEKALTNQAHGSMISISRCSRKKAKRNLDREVAESVGRRLGLKMIGRRSLGRKLHGPRESLGKPATPAGAVKRDVAMTMAGMRLTLGTRAAMVGSRVAEAAATEAVPLGIKAMVLRTIVEVEVRMLGRRMQCGIRATSGDSHGAIQCRDGDNIVQSTCCPLQLVHDEFRNDLNVLGLCEFGVVCVR
mmetsp:Transcript_9445/g.15284  ORF Transcript_9445/g.15284 Transcript_9445/m.15284 type:complete len:210 (+) Transcript_9445:381-1010(+)